MDFEKLPFAGAANLAKTLLTCVIAGYLTNNFIKFFLHKRSVSKKIKYLRSPPSYPIVGSGYLLFGKTDIIGVIEKLMVEYDVARQPVAAWMGPKLIICCARPEDLKVILNSPYATSKHELYDLLRPALGNGILTSSGQIWKQHRKLIGSVFSTTTLESFVPKFKDLGDVLVQKLNAMVGKGSFDAYELIAPCSFEMLCESTFGVKVAAQNDENTIKHIRAALEVMHILNKRIFQLWMHPDLLFKLSGWEKKQSINLEEAIIMRHKILDAKSKEDSILKNGRLTILNILLEQINKEDGDRWTMKDLHEELDTILITGIETSSTNVSLVMMMLGIHKEIQNKVVEEIRDIFGDTKRPIEAEDIKNLVYLDQVIKEGLRLYPVVPYIGRHTLQDIKLDSCTIPAGTGIMIGIRHLHTDKIIWGEDADLFDPDRFSPERSAGRHPYAFIPFSAGPRNCLGMRYAKIATTFMLVTILRNFVIKCDTKLEDIKINVNITLTPVDGFKVSLERRLPAI